MITQECTIVKIQQHTVALFQIVCVFKCMSVCLCDTCLRFCGNESRTITDATLHFKSMCFYGNIVPDRTAQIFSIKDNNMYYICWRFLHPMSPMTIYLINSYVHYLNKSIIVQRSAATNLLTQSIIFHNRSYSTLSL